MSKKVNIGVSYPESDSDGWYFKAIFGPFETKEEAAKSSTRIAFLEIPDNLLRSLAEMPYVTAFVLPKSDDPPSPITPT